VHAHHPWSTPPPLIAARRTWPSLALAGIAAALAAAALIVGLTKPVPAPMMSPTYTADDIDVAQRQLCDTYKLAAHSAQVDTAGGDKALARIALTNGAVMLETAAADPVLDAHHRTAARALAMSYLSLTAKGASGLTSDAEYQAALDEANARDAAMRRLCNGS
jgi:hypothetical protein